jgi:hyperosmotically inducible periplasmic protein
MERAIATEPALKRPYDIKVNVSGGRLTLNGTVASAVDIERLDRIARGIEGVKEVDNRLQAPAPLSDEQLRAKILEALAREPEMDTSGVEISVKDGVAYFTGSVPNHRKIDRILATAVMVDGVKDIRSSVVGGRGESARPRARGDRY